MELMDFQRHFQEVEIKRRSQRTEGERRTVFSEKTVLTSKIQSLKIPFFSDRIVVNLNSRIHEQNEFFYETHLGKGEKETRNRVMLEFKACQSHVYHNFHPNCSVILEGPSWFNSTKGTCLCKIHHQSCNITTKKAHGGVMIPPRLVTFRIPGRNFRRWGFFACGEKNASAAMSFVNNNRFTRNHIFNTCDLLKNTTSVLVLDDPIKKTFTKTPSWKWRLEIPQGLRNKKPSLFAYEKQGLYSLYMKKVKVFFQLCSFLRRWCYILRPILNEISPQRGQNYTPANYFHVATEVTGVYLLTICTRSCTGTTRKESSFRV